MAKIGRLRVRPNVTCNSSAGTAFNLAMSIYRPSMALSSAPSTELRNPVSGGEPGPSISGVGIRPGTSTFLHLHHHQLRKDNDAVPTALGNGASKSAAAPEQYPGSGPSRMTCRTIKHALPTASPTSAVSLIVATPNLLIYTPSASLICHCGIPLRALSLMSLEELFSLGECTLLTRSNIDPDSREY